MPAMSDRSHSPHSTAIKTKLTLICVTIVSIIVISLLFTQFKQYLFTQMNADTAAGLQVEAANLSSVIDSRLLLSKVITAFALSQLVEHNELNEQTFQQFAAHIIQNMDCIRYLSIYPNNKAPYSYPADHDFVPYDSSSSTSSDKISLFYEGDLLIAQQSITHNGQHWGYTAVIIDIPSLFAEKQLGHNDARNHQTHALRTDNHYYLFGDESSFGEWQQTIELPYADHNWEMSASPSTDRKKQTLMQLWLVLLISLALLSAIIYGSYSLLTKRRNLEALVEERTLNLEHSNNELANTYNELAMKEKELRDQIRNLEGKEQLMRHMAYHDTLTDLYNRTYFNERMEKLIAHYEYTDRIITVMALDIDNFKVINDTVGHYYGDQLLNEVGKRLANELKYTDTIARLSGDKYAIIFTDLTDIEMIKQKANRIHSLFSKPFSIKGAEQYITVSIAVALCPDHGNDLNTLIRNIDSVLDRIKESGKDQVMFYENNLDMSSEDVMEVMNDLRHALDNNEFFIHYQPQVNAVSGEITGLEALLRWNHPVKGMIPPGSFISIAEKTGLIVPIGERVLEMVCEQSRVWQAAGIPPIKIAVNLSTKQLLQRNINERIISIVSHYELEPSHLELEITENMATREDMQPRLHELRSMGFHISIDDFGTHYSSLSYLKNLPIDKIKVDRSFVRGIANDNKDEAIIQAVLLIAERLELGVIAEGVETQEQLTFLMHNNCTNIQGFYYYKPLPYDQIESLLRKQFNMEQA